MLPSVMLSPPRSPTLHSCKKTISQLDEPCHFPILPMCSLDQLTEISKARQAPRTPRGIPHNTPNEFGHSTPKENVVTTLVLFAPHTRPIPWPMSFENLVAARNSVPSHLPKEDLNLGRDPCFPNVPLLARGADLKISLYREPVENLPDGSKLPSSRTPYPHHWTAYCSNARWPAVANPLHHAGPESAENWESISCPPKDLRLWPQGH